jgi:Holliday junction resolvasome RuvABC DNA-binding subunit
MKNSVRGIAKKITKDNRQGLVVEMARINFDVSAPSKLAFQLKCTKNRVMMTAVLREFVEQYVKA